MKMLRAAAIAVLAGYVLSTNPAGGATAPAGSPIEIPAILSLSGPAAFLGKAEQSGLTVVETEVNAAGGIAGRPVRFVVADDQSNAQVAVQLFNSVAKSAPIVIGPSLTASCGAIAPLLKDGPVLYCLSPGFHPEKGSWAFSWGPATTDLIAMNVRYYRARGLKKLALITSTDATGQDGERGVDAALALPENKDMTLVAREHYSPGDVSVAAQISRIKASGAQALIAWGTGTPIGTVFHGIIDAGLEIPVGMSAGNCIFPLLKQFGGFVPKQLIAAGFAAVAYEGLPEGPVKQAARQYTSAFKAIGVKADASEVIGWDPARIIASGYRKLGPGATAAQFKEYLSTLRGFAGATGMYDFTEVPQRGISVLRSGVMVEYDPSKEAFYAISKFGGAPLR